MTRLILAAVAGYLVWTALWLTGNAVLFDDTAALAASNLTVTDPIALLEILGYSAACSWLAGNVAAHVAMGRELRAAQVLAGGLFVTGLVVQVGVWKYLPFWYNAAFLILLIPIPLAGAHFVLRRRQEASPFVHSK